MSFGKRLSYLRENKNLTQNELAKATNISRSRLSLYEIDKREPDINTIKQLADFFNITTDYLLDRTDDLQSQLITSHCTDDPTKQLPKEARKSLEDFKKFLYEKHGLKFD